MKTKVFAKLKPKAASLGFSKDELEGIAADIASNLNSEDATDEDIDARIDAALPFLKVAQKAANRAIEDARKKATSNPDETDPAQGKNSGSQTPPHADDEPSWFRKHREATEKHREATEKRLEAIETEKVVVTRKSQLEAIVKDAGAFGTKTLKDFSRMNFESDDAFNEYLEETKADAEAFKQEAADKGLGDSYVPVGGGSTKEDSEKIAALINAGTKEITNNSKN